MTEIAEAASTTGLLKVDLTETVHACKYIPKGTAEGWMEVDSI
jgi:hypothetical protein